MASQVPHEQLFLVERYLPGMAVEEVRVLANRAAGLADPATVDYRWSLLCIDEQTGFCLFAASHRLAIAELNRRAGFPVGRMSSVVLLELDG